MSGVNEYFEYPQFEVFFSAYPIPITQFQVGKPLNYDVLGIFNGLKESLYWNSIFLL